MKKVQLLVVCILTAVFAISSYAQATTAQPANLGKIGIINTFDFGDEKNGIVKYVNAIKALDTEFKPLQTELQAMTTKYESLRTEIENLQKLAQSNPKAIDEKAAQAKVEEAEKLQRDFKFKSEEAETRFKKRQQEVMAPIMQDIYKAIQEYTEKKGYTMILDVGRMAEAEVIMGIDQKSLLTQDFITFYNARPATTATTGTPK